MGLVWISHLLKVFELISFIHHHVLYKDSVMFALASFSNMSIKIAERPEPKTSYNKTQITPREVARVGDAKAMRTVGV